jgi:hypothetical protein
MKVYDVKRYAADATKFHWVAATSDIEEARNYALEYVTDGFKKERGKLAWKNKETDERVWVSYREVTVMEKADWELEIDKLWAENASLVANNGDQNKIAANNEKVKRLEQQHTQEDG